MSGSVGSNNWGDPLQRQDVESASDSPIRTSSPLSLLLLCRISRYPPTSPPLPLPDITNLPYPSYNYYYSSYYTSTLPLILSLFALISLLSFYSSWVNFLDDQMDISIQLANGLGVNWVRIYDSQVSRST